MSFFRKRVKAELTLKQEKSNKGAQTGGQGWAILKCLGLTSVIGDLSYLWEILGVWEFVHKFQLLLLDLLGWAGHMSCRLGKGFDSTEWAEPYLTLELIFGRKDLIYIKQEINDHVPWIFRKNLVLCFFFLIIDTDAKWNNFSSYLWMTFSCSETNSFKFVMDVVARRCGHRVSRASQSSVQHQTLAVTMGGKAGRSSL